MSSNLRIATVSGLVSALTWVVCSVPLRAQATAEYTLGAAKAASGATGFGNVMNRGLTKAAGKVSDNLKSAIHRSPGQVMKENREVLEKHAVGDGGVLCISSDPNDAAVFVDGKLVERTPAEIKVPKGKHEIMVTRPDRDQWTKQVSVAKGQTVELHAELVNTNPSVISLTFPDKKK